METKRFNLLDIIKGLMIIFIIIAHFGFAYPDDYMKYGFFYWIDMAVPVFMIITGYLSAFKMEKQNSLIQAYSIESIIKKSLRFLIPWLPVVLAEMPIMLLQRTETIDIVKNIIGGGVRTRFLLHSYNDTNDFSWSGNLLCCEEI